ncbi:MAG: hypothetical protein HKM04_03165 [Legionellales bacterium]|nr:hypothetical protein [Legionellales bacterium]
MPPTFFPSVPPVKRRFMHRLTGTTFILDAEYTVCTGKFNNEGNFQLFYNEALISFLQKYSFCPMYLHANTRSPRTMHHVSRTELIQHLSTQGIQIQEVFTQIDVKVFSVKYQKSKKYDLSKTILGSYQLGDHYKNIVAPAEKAFVELKKQCSLENINPNLLFDHYINNNALYLWLALVNKNNENEAKNEIDLYIKEGKVSNEVGNRLKEFITMFRTNIFDPNSLDIKIQSSIKLVHIKGQYLTLIDKIFNSTLIERQIEYLCDTIKTYKIRCYKAKLLPYILRKHHQIKKIVFIDDTMRELSEMAKIFKKWHIPGIVTYPPLPRTQVVRDNFNNAEDCVSQNEFEYLVLSTDNLTPSNSKNSPLQNAFRDVRKAANNYTNLEKQAVVIKITVNNLLTLQNQLIKTASPEITNFRSYKIKLLSIICTSPSYKPRQLIAVLDMSRETLKDTGIKILDDFLELLNESKNKSSRQNGLLTTIQQFALTTEEYQYSHPLIYANSAFWRSIASSIKGTNEIKQNISELLSVRNQFIIKEKEPIPAEPQLKANYDFSLHRAFSI